jgi:hypothetical protein
MYYPWVGGRYSCIFSCTLNTEHTLFVQTFFPEIRAIYVLMWEIMVEPDWRMRFAWWIPKASDTHSEYLIIIVL